jgi:hypothetical protein
MTIYLNIGGQKYFYNGIPPIGMASLQYVPKLRLIGKVIKFIDSKGIVTEIGDISGGSRTKAEKPKWVSTGRKVTYQKRGSPAAQKTVFHNSVTEELRVRKATLAKDGTRHFAYVKF